MNPISRRQFLQLTGIAFVGSQLSSIHLFDHTPAVQQVHGRALVGAPVRAFPSAAAPTLGRLWPDSITPALSAYGEWYRLEHGYTERQHIQPMKPYQPNPQPPAIHEPFWAEVAGPVAAVRQFCAANAPQIARIGHGGVARVIDYLPDSPSAWYGIAAEDGSLLGWSQAVNWQPAAARADERVVAVEVRLDQRQLLAWGADRLLLQSPCSLGNDCQPGSYQIIGRQTALSLSLAEPSGRLHGVPWVIQFEGGELVGAYWHNQFGRSTAVPGPAVQLPPIAAEWLYAALETDAPILMR